ncbi:hypothetical protein [Microbacterium sp.]|uniref:hypothetical protein n=1 Tax=Microbacterium sp. TaxID=51671 RepID=UPI003C71E330
MSLHITGDTAADELLTENPLALLVGMLLDQQVPMETAFAGPLKIQQRTEATDAATVAATAQDRSVADIVSPESLAKVREHKKAMKAAAKAAKAAE